MSFAEKLRKLQEKEDLETIKKDCQRVERMLTLHAHEGEWTARRATLKRNYNHILKWAKEEGISVSENALGVTFSWKKEEEAKVVEEVKVEEAVKVTEEEVKKDAEVVASVSDSAEGAAVEKDKVAAVEEVVAVLPEEGGSAGVVSVPSVVSSEGANDTL